jgi:tRNA dimethylallyltransferase
MLSLEPRSTLENSTLNSKLIPLVVILGPTAVGKSEIAIQLAERLGGEIISADSRLFYRGMDIGTAKPSVEERERVPHHLIDVAEPDEIWSLTVFQSQARQRIEEVHNHGRLPFLVGGTGQYIRAVTQGWQAPGVQPNPRLRAALDAWARRIGTEALHQRLRIIDPKAAAVIDHRNLRRTIRALEVILSTGKRFSDQRQSGKEAYDLLQLGLRRPRAELYERIDARIDQMLAEGLVEEVQSLLKRGYEPSLPSLSAIGYREIIAYLQGKISLEDSVREMRHNTRVFVRRQANWFKANDPQIHWFSYTPTVAGEMESEIRTWLERGKSN